MKNNLSGLRHLALRVSDITRSKNFYRDILGMEVVWEPDPNNVYLSSGLDNLALHQAESKIDSSGISPLDHFGFMAESESGVDAFYQALQGTSTPIIKQPKKHRDGSYSFYFSDPDGNAIQIIYESRLCPG